MMSTAPGNNKNSFTPALNPNQVTYVGRRAREDDNKPAAARSNHDLLKDKDNLFRINAWKTAIPTDHFWQPSVHGRLDDTCVCAICGCNLKSARLAGFESLVRCPNFDKYGPINNQGDLQAVVLKREAEQEMLHYQKERERLENEIKEMRAKLNEKN